MSEWTGVFLFNCLLCLTAFWNHLPASPYSSYPLRGRRRVRLTHYEPRRAQRGLSELIMHYALFCLVGFALDRLRFGNARNKKAK